MSEAVIIFLAARLYIVVLLIGTVSALVVSRNKRRGLLWMTVVALPVSFLASRIVSTFYYNPRPFVVDGLVPLLQHAADNGFPSDHTLLVATVSFIVLAYNKKMGLLLLFLSVLVGLGRVLAGVHHVLDIVGSFFVAAAAVYVSFVLVHAYIKYIDRYATKIQ